MGSVAHVETFPDVDPVGPHDPMVTVPGARVIAQVIAPAAAQSDREGVPRSHLDALAHAGLLGTALKPAATQRELAELLAGSDATTWFCWVQHQSPLLTLEAAVDGPLTPAVTDLQARLLPGMRDGSIVNAVAFAHVRRPGPPNPVAQRVDGGWLLRGSLDWVTSWDIADVVMIMAQGEDDYAGQLISAFVPAGRDPAQRSGLRVGEPLRLLAMSGTHTRPITLENHFVPDEAIGGVHDRVTWLSDDAQRTADPNPSAFGVARGAIAELSALANSRGDARMAALATSLVHECRDVRSASYAAMDEDDRAATREARLRLRAQSLELAARAATSVVVARAGASMLEGSSAGRRLREAMFLQVQAQTADTRAASLTLLKELAGE